MAATAVLMAVRTRAETALAAAIDAHPGLAVAARCADLAEAAAAAEAGVGALVLISEQPHLTRDVVADLRHWVSIVGIAESPDAAARLRLLGVTDVITTPEPSACASHLAAVASAAPPIPPAREVSVADGAQPTRGRVLTVWGPTGAPGRTTVALNLAAALAHRGHSTVVIDADTYGGAISQACGLLDEAPGLAGLARAARSGAVSDADVYAHATPIAPNLQALTGISRPQRWHELPAAALDVVWEAAGRCFDWVVIDAGFGIEHDEELTYDTHAPQRNGATLSALVAADRVVAVGTAEPLGVQRLIHGLEMLESHNADPMVVMNRVRADVAGPQPQQALADALTRFAGVDRAWMLPWDAKAADSATLAGQLVRELSPRSRLAKAFDALASAVETEVTTPPSARTPAADASVLTH
ncbi:AAA family ATPase [Demequina flava]|uniref:AAA family ATPase n=1 Tax=Demequina flava TaxID=1095025 RepID=UPI000784189B|nr:hypothetical protein [Demequina flava]